MAQNRQVGRNPVTIPAHRITLKTPKTVHVPTTRSNGLDTLRAIAILLVLMYHYMCFVSHQATFGWGSEVGWVGVDLFFVLSGYLIGNQVFAGMVKGNSISLLAFYMRRALRTWPLFWVILAAYFLSHKAVFMVIARYGEQMALDPALRLAAISVATVALGALLYRLVELPYMQVRDQKFPSLYGPPTGKGAASSVTP